MIKSVELALEFHEYCNDVLCKALQMSQLVLRRSHPGLYICTIIAAMPKLEKNVVSGESDLYKFKKSLNKAEEMVYGTSKVKLHRKTHMTNRSRHPRVVSQRITQSTASTKPLCVLKIKSRITKRNQALMQLGNNAQKHCCNVMQKQHTVCPNELLLGRPSRLSLSQLIKSKMDSQQYNNVSRHDELHADPKNATKQQVQFELQQDAYNCHQNGPLDEMDDEQNLKSLNDTSEILTSSMGQNGIISEYQFHGKYVKDVFDFDFFEPDKVVPELGGYSFELCEKTFNENLERYRTELILEGGVDVGIQGRIAPHHSLDGLFVCEYFKQ